MICNKKYNDRYINCSVSYSVTHQDTWANWYENRSKCIQGNWFIICAQWQVVWANQQNEPYACKSGRPRLLRKLFFSRKTNVHVQKMKYVRNMYLAKAQCFSQFSDSLISMILKKETNVVVLKEEWTKLVTKYDSQKNDSYSKVQYKPYKYLVNI